MSDTASAPYQVLARKYRPATFDDLYGQEPMVRTLRNAFAANRIPHAWMLTGVRGVGKTTTARILARGLNFEHEDGSGEPTVDLPEEGVHCRAIMEGRHPDVMEMDAASHTGIDDIRDLIDSSRYAPVSARYKVYIVDEVHMLSKAAFNGLLKTLEEPPAHVKFIFATTEIRRVPITVLSRCQRFDLRRIEAATLIDLLSRIAGTEGIDAEPQALRQIARAAEGSARDALSILDQAIAHGAGTVEAETVQAMLGLADRGRVVDLFEQILAGDIAAALSELQAQHDTGADPLAVLIDLADFCHYVTRLKLAPNAAVQAAISETERVRGAALAETLTIRILSRLWQMLLNGIDEVGRAPRPMAAADMVLVRLCHAADLPTPDEAIRMATGSAAETRGPDRPQRASASGGAASAAPALASRPAPQAPPQGDPGPQLRRYEDVVALARAERDPVLAFALERHVRPVRFDTGLIEISLTPEADSDLPQRLGQRLQEWTGRRWIIAVSKQDGADTMHELRERNRANLLEEVRSDPAVAAVLAHFPAAEIIGVRERETAAGRPEKQAAVEALPAIDDDEDDDAEARLDPAMDDDYRDED